jgi:hypothetical protein
MVDSEGGGESGGGGSHPPSVSSSSAGSYIPAPRHGCDIPTPEEIKKQLCKSRALKDIKPLQTPPIMLRSGITLMEHQKLGLGWMTDIERQHSGGLLADDMGLGKTIQTIACILHNVPAQSQPEFRRVGGIVGHTLIVCPLAVLEQWEREINRMSGGKLRVYIHHGPNAANRRGERKHIETMLDHDIVLTTYGKLTKDGPKLKKKVGMDSVGLYYHYTATGLSALDLVADDDDHDSMRQETRTGLGPLMQVHIYVNTIVTWVPAVTTCMPYIHTSALPLI